MLRHGGSLCDHHFIMAPGSPVPLLVSIVDQVAPFCNIAPLEATPLGSTALRRIIIDSDAEDHDQVWATVPLAGQGARD